MLPFSQQLAAVIRARSWSSSAEAARQLGVDRTYLSRLLSEQVPVGARIVARVCEHLTREEAAQLVRAYLLDEVGKVHAESKAPRWEPESLVDVKIAAASPPKTQSPQPTPLGYWPLPAVITPNNFVYKSLSNWAFNIAIGCGHACRFCYVPSSATIKLSPKLREFGVDDPDEQWGDYVLLREWDEEKFLRSLAKAEQTPRRLLKKDGNRAVIYCSTTDPYQVFRHPDPTKRKELANAARKLVRRSLELVLKHSTLNVRILTRSPLARDDFDLFMQFGPRLVFGMSLPTLRDDLSKIYEPRAPAPSQRLAVLKAAKAAGLHVYVAVAPTYPECDEADLRATLTAVAELEPITVFHEPINMRAENIARIAKHAASLGVKLKSEVFASREAWKDYALAALNNVQKIAGEVGLSEKLHLWPDKNLGSAWVVASMAKPQEHQAWLNKCWSRLSEWPT